MPTCQGKIGVFDGFIIRRLWMEEGAASFKGTLAVGFFEDKQWPMFGKEKCCSLVFCFYRNEVPVL